MYKKYIKSLFQYDQQKTKNVPKIRDDTSNISLTGWQKTTLMSKVLTVQFAAC